MSASPNTPTERGQFRRPVCCHTLPATPVFPRQNCTFHHSKLDLNPPLGQQYTFRSRAPDDPVHKTMAVRKAAEMAQSLNSFKFDDQLAKRLEQLSAQSDSLPPFRPLSRPRPVPQIQITSSNANDSPSPDTTDQPAGLPPQHPTPDSQHLPPNSQHVNEFDLSQTAMHVIECDSGAVWIQGNSLLCACPDCKAPITIRTWLQLADCWRCQTSIALSEEQINATNQLLREPLSPTPPSTDPAPARTPLEAPAPTFAIDPAPSPVPEDNRQLELEKLTRGSLAAHAIRNWFSLSPAVLISFLVHLIAILILALIVFNQDGPIPETITLSTFLDSRQELGGEFRMDNPLDALQDDLQRASDMAEGDEEIREILVQANQDARELTIDPRPVTPLPDLERVKQNITMRPDQLMSFAARDPRVRSEMVRKEGGTTITEAAVARGIRWLASVQNKDGSWSLKNFDRHSRSNNKGDIMGTSLALLPMLGAGQTPEFGIYKQNVAAGIAWLIENQKPDGDLRAGLTGEAGMYAHGQAAIVLCETLALTGDQRLRDPAQRAIEFIESAQHKQGGWRYRPGQAGDTSVFGWQMMAIQSARAPQLNLTVDSDTLTLANHFLDRVTASAEFKQTNRPLPDGAAYGYQPGRRSTAAMTAEAILCRMYLGWNKRDPRLSSAVKWLIDDHLPNADDKNLYYWYYGTQVMHHYGGTPWEKWNDKMRELLISTQKTSGSWPGSWPPNKFEWGSRGGRIYTTSLAVCTLEVYYRHLPIFKQIEFDE